MWSIASSGRTIAANAQIEFRERVTGNILISGNWRKMNAIKSSCQVRGARRGDHCLLRHPRPISGRQGRTPIPPGGKRAMTLFQGAERRT